MSSPNITIDYLARHPELTRELAEFFYGEWRSIYDERGQSFNDVLSAFKERANIHSLPLALVGFHRERLIGAVSLKIHDLDIRPELTPWLGGLFVVPASRHRGFGTALIERALDEAQRLKLKRLYLWTTSAESLYLKLGWSEVERADYCGHQIVVMQRDIN